MDNKQFRNIITIILISTVSILIILFYVYYNTNLNRVENISTLQLTKFKLEGHTFIKFNDNTLILHDPDCKKCDSIQNAKLDKLVGSLEMGEE